MRDVLIKFSFKPMWLHNYIALAKLVSVVAHGPLVLIVQRLQILVYIQLCAFLTVVLFF